MKSFRAIGIEDSNSCFLNEGNLLARNQTWMSGFGGDGHNFKSAWLQELA